jgi:hypothetical protein
MVVLEDFTKIPQGCDVPDGHVRPCPRCGRSGVEGPSEEGIPLFVHSQVSEVIGDGMRVELQDCCSLSTDDVLRRADSASPFPTG